MKGEIDDVFMPGYEPPLSFIYEPVKVDFDEMCVNAVQNVGIYVDKDQLACIIRGDRQRYEAAYRNGYNAAKAEYEAKLAAIVGIAQERGQNGSA